MSGWVMYGTGVCLPGGWRWLVERGCVLASLYLCKVALLLCPATFLQHIHRLPGRSVWQLLDVQSTRKSVVLGLAMC